MNYSISNNNMSTDIKLTKAQISKIIQSGGSFGFCLANIGKRALTNIAIPLARDNLPGLVSNLTSNVINKFERNVSGQRSCQSKEKDILYLFQMKI